MMRSRTPLVDVHANFVTDDYVATAITAGHREADSMPWPVWDAGQNLKLMDQWGVGSAVLSVSSPGTHFGDSTSARALSREVNEFGAAVTRKYPGRFGHFASLPLPDVPGCLDALRYALDELGSDGRHCPDHRARHLSGRRLVRACVGGAQPTAGGPFQRLIPDASADTS
jgi:6-methylsalicylate decarboxylase